jgi:hypothetical protein
LPYDWPHGCGHEALTTHAASRNQSDELRFVDASASILAVGGLGREAGLMCRRREGCDDSILDAVVVHDVP